MQHSRTYYWSMHRNGSFLYIQSHLILYLSSFALCRISKTLAAPPINSETPTPIVIFDPPKLSKRDFIMHLSEVPNSSVNTITHTKFLNLSSLRLEKRIIIMARKFVVYFLPALLLLINFLCYFFLGERRDVFTTLYHKHQFEWEKDKHLLRFEASTNPKHSIKLSFPCVVTSAYHKTLNILITKSTAVFLKPTIALINSPNFSEHH